MPEISDKLLQLRGLLAARRLDGILVQRTANFSWLTAGATGYVNIASTTGAASILVTADAHYIVANNIEAPRLEAEERLAARGFQFLISPWHRPNLAASDLLGALRLGADVPYPGAQDVTADLASLRLTLTPAEVMRFRETAGACASAMDEAIRRVRPGMTEMAIAGLLSQAAYARCTLPIVNLVATDERVFRYRHPLPTQKTLEKYAMLVLCGRRYGLVASITRLVHFGPLPPELQRKQTACAQVDATLIAHTRPGTRLADVFRAAGEAYVATGFPGEWENHHQGGLAGYEPRELLANADSSQLVRAGQVYAWNPSIAGVKSEDTILVGDQGNDVLTTSAGWPMLPVEIAGQVWPRPAILET